MISGAVMFFEISPLIGYVALKKYYLLSQTVIVVNIKTNELVKNVEVKVTGNPTNDYINTLYYKAFYKIKH